MPKGKTGNPRGRPRGAKNKTTLLKEDALAKLIKDKKTPLDFMLSVMTNVNMPLHLRMDAAKSAAPYVHKKQVAVEGNGPGGSFIHQHRGGVMLIAAPQSAEDWEQRAAATQHALLVAAATEASAEDE